MEILYLIAERGSQEKETSKNNNFDSKAFFANRNQSLKKHKLNNERVIKTGYFVVL